MTKVKTSSAHAAGPWIIKQRDCFFSIGPQPPSHLDFRPLAQTWASTDEEALANARLIAAAPELLEACKVAVDALNQIPNRRFDSYPHKNTYSVCSMLDALIAKVEGR